MEGGGALREPLFRSYLYVVGYRADHIAKAYRSEADAVILELEDAVPAERKGEARNTIHEVLASEPPKPTYVRINPVGSEHVEADLAAVAHLPLVGLRVAKVARPAEVRALSASLAELGSPLSLHLLLESATAVEAAPVLLAADPRVAGVALGEQDLSADLGVTSDDGLAYARSRVVMAAAAAGIAPPVQSVWTNIHDLQGLRSSCELGRRLGFVGRAAIHPDQLGVINDVYTPDDAEVAEAEELERELANGLAGGDASLRLADGRFVDRAVVRAARRTLALRRGAGAPHSTGPDGHTEPPPARRTR